jgi:hypothetical protein
VCLLLMWVNQGESQRGNPCEDGVFFWKREMFSLLLSSPYQNKYVNTIAMAIIISSLKKNSHSHSYSHKYLLTRQGHGHAFFLYRIEKIRNIIEN